MSRASSSMHAGAPVDGRVRPLRDLGGRLLEVEKPARYLGGEMGAVRKEGDGYYDIALCFPDLYEIGMSNNAIRILYDGLNRIENVRCERVFAPAPDFEALLASRGLPLYTLESGLALNRVDLVGFSLGYELAATSILSVLSSGGIPILASERGEADPIVIAGGPAISNPHPFARFLDAAWIGEAEGAFLDLAAELGSLKRAGGKRTDAMELIAREAAVWMPGAAGMRPGKPARRSVFPGFTSSDLGRSAPIPTLKTVQDHGTVEIMRGCPNGCRFCHAGYYYRPQRVKTFAAIESEVEGLIRAGGHREITLTSLSSGDYPGLPQLLASLNARWSGKRVSFQLPSLKVNTFTLPLIAQLAEVRKSGLTFAVETPVDQWQLLLNKDVNFEKTVSILEEARARGFKQAKFYFMIGLPVPGSPMDEAAAILEYFDRLNARIRLNINVNVGTFVPKPHTPFQWCRQIGEDEALSAFNEIRSGLRRYRSIKLSYHSPFISELEGIIARGDERVGELILEAFKRGARLDAWEDRFDRELWRSVLAGASFAPIAEYSQARRLEERLPWDDVSINVSKAYLYREYRAAIDTMATSICMENCTHPCGSCTDGAGIVLNTGHSSVDNDQPGADLARPSAPEPAPVSGRILFTYSKRGIASYYPHLSIIEAFSRSFLIADLPICYSEGFNPAPRLETAQPLPIAVESDAEIASVLVSENLPPDLFVTEMNKALPEGVRVESASFYPIFPGVRQWSLGALSWGSEFEVSAEGVALIEALSEELDKLGVAFDLTDSNSLRVRLSDPASKEAGLPRILERCTAERPAQKAFAVRRRSCLAQLETEPMSYDEAYRRVSKPRGS